jgi:hypothetical protein
METDEGDSTVWGSGGRLGLQGVAALRWTPGEGKRRNTCGSTRGSLWWRLLLGRSTEAAKQRWWPAAWHSGGGGVGRPARLRDGVLRRRGRGARARARRLGAAALKSAGLPLAWHAVRTPRWRRRRRPWRPWPPLANGPQRARLGRSGCGSGLRARPR